MPQKWMGNCKACGDNVHALTKDKLVETLRRDHASCLRWADISPDELTPAKLNQAWWEHK